MPISDSRKTRIANFVHHLLTIVRDILEIFLKKNFRYFIETKMSFMQTFTVRITVNIMELINH